MPQPLRAGHKPRPAPHRQRYRPLTCKRGDPPLSCSTHGHSIKLTTRRLWTCRICLSSNNSCLATFSPRHLIPRSHREEGEPKPVRGPEKFNAYKRSDPSCGMWIQNVRLASLTWSRLGHAVSSQGRIQSSGTPSSYMDKLDNGQGITLDFGPTAIESGPHYADLSREKAVPQYIDASDPRWEGDGRQGCDDLDGKMVVDRPTEGWRESSSRSWRKRRGCPDKSAATDMPAAEGKKGSFKTVQEHNRPRGNTSLTRTG